MLMLVNTFGLSHVCAFQEFQNIGEPFFQLLPYNFPYLDIYLPGRVGPGRAGPGIEFYSRGTKDRKLKFKNLFEYLLWTASNGQG